MRASRLRRLMNVWPPFLFAGIRVERIAEDFREVEVALHRRWYNRNYVGTHFGGSLFAMTDPFWMIMVMENLGRDYVVWDSAAEIEFVRPGRGSVRCRFQLDSDTLRHLREATDGGETARPWFAMTVLDDKNETVARVRKQLYIRRKRRTLSAALAKEPDA